MKTLRHPYFDEDARVDIQRKDVMLLVGSEPDTSQAVATCFQDGEVALRKAHDGNRALALMFAEPPDLVLTEVTLPDMPAAEFIESIRTWCTTPIIAVSGDHRQETVTKLLDAGADDFVAKPFGLDEFRARVRVALRRRRGMEPDNGPFYLLGGTAINLFEKTAMKDGVAIALTPLEFKILGELVRAAGKVVTHRSLMAKIWTRSDDNYVRTLRVYIGELRKKLKIHTEGDMAIESISGVGYRLVCANLRD